MSFPSPFYRWRPHPWHGLEAGPKAPEVVLAYIEITPYDTVKYEIDKTTGYMRVDRPQRSSSQPPSLYGFVPRTYCGERVGALNKNAKRGDEDPLDICVVSERPITKAEVILDAFVVGGLQVTDNEEADDKIIAVLENDNAWGGAREISDLPDIIIERLRHYFDTYRLVPGEGNTLSVDGVYGRDQARKVIRASMEDYEEAFGTA
ncbi:MAG: inorganic pyrophosphatase [Candidatus Eisenbacteria bacterium]|uniref:inorganic diphosphatase n=1 Tax=Eiseniibacteriota bacterium TaxID=2212470 RepID=A0A7Y2E760_UNCEI|nr:inorganic pyrophosphatase [Candidatus Eisenbacteria bacterium]